MKKKQLYDVSTRHAASSEMSDIITANKKSFKLGTQYQELYDFSPCCYFTIDQAGCIQAVNFSAAALLGVKRQFLLKKQFADYVSWDSQAAFQKYLTDLFDFTNKESCELELLQIGGTRAHVTIKSFLLEKDRVLLTVTNITEKRQLEMRFIEQNKSLTLLNSLFQQSENAKAILGIDLCFILFNQGFSQIFSKLFAVKVEVGKNLINLLADFPTLKTDVLALFQRDKQHEQEKKILIENENIDDNLYYCYEISFHSYKHTLTNNYIGISIRNISEYKLKQRQQLKQQAVLAEAVRTNAVGEMAAALAHEINQPLASINIYSHSCFEYVKRLSNPSENLLNGLTRIVSLSKHAGEILHRMKNFIREGELCKEEVDINTVVKYALTFLDLQKKELKFKIDLLLHENLPFIFLDKVKITQVILNLAQNSIESLPQVQLPQLRITMETKMVNKNIEMHFFDNGPGISKDILPKIMKSYFTTKPHGTGLGLGICRTLIEAHGGKLTIQEPTQGAWIKIILPIKTISNESGMA